MLPRRPPRLSRLPALPSTLLAPGPSPPFPSALGCPAPTRHSDGVGKGKLTAYGLHRAQGTRVLVHCKMGVSRSAATVIAYAMKQYGWSLEQALRHVQELRPIARPNPGFLRQLQTYQGILTARYAVGGQGRGCGGGRWVTKVDSGPPLAAGRVMSGSRKQVGPPQRSPWPPRSLHRSHLFSQNRGAVGS